MRKFATMTRHGPSPQAIRPPSRINMWLARVVVLTACAIVPQVSYTQANGTTLPVSLYGQTFEYTVQPGDFLIRIGARFGIAAKIIAEENSIQYDAVLQPGQVLKLSNLHIVPRRLDNGILINIPQRMLFHFENGKLIAAYPVGLGKRDWPTPVGPFYIQALAEDKAWNVPRSIQQEMEREKQVVLTCVPPGPDNPLGRHWIGLSIRGIGIHGTIAPASVYHFESHGCIRMHHDDVAELFSRVTVGTLGQIIYEPVLVAALPDGRIYLEVHRDVYSRSVDNAAFADALLKQYALSDRTDADRVREAVERRVGLAVDVSNASRLPVE